jgi:hypothetical protein
MYDIAKSGINHYVPVFGYYFWKKFTGGNVWRLDATKTKKREIAISYISFLSILLGVRIIVLIFTEHRKENNHCYFALVSLNHTDANYTIFNTQIGIYSIAYDMDIFSEMRVCIRKRKMYRKAKVYMN